MSHHINKNYIMGIVAFIRSPLVLAPTSHLTSKGFKKPLTLFELFLISSSVKIKIKGVSNLIPGQHLIATCTLPSSCSE